MSPPFAVWITGLPSSGKSTLTAALRAELEARGIRAAVLESDALRAVLTPRPKYDQEERDSFYGAMLHIGKMLLDHGVPVIFDATAHRRKYREQAREQIRRFLEVYVACPLEVCRQRDPKGIYRRGQKDPVGSVPGLHEEYEPPENPDVMVHGDRASPEAAARRIVSVLQEKQLLTRS